LDGDRWSEHLDPDPRPPRQRMSPDVTTRVRDSETQVMQRADARDPGNGWVLFAGLMFGYTALVGTIGGVAAIRRGGVRVDPSGEQLAGV
jgi:hypothetical protein